MRQRLAPFFALSVLAILPLAHSQISGSSLGDQSTQTDCSDPLMAQSSACNQNPNSQNTLGTSGLGTNPYSQQNNNQPGSASSVNSTYTDNGGLGNQLRFRVQNGRITQQPELLTEFQKFVAGTTNQILPIFGANLFQDIPSTFAPVDQVPVTPDYVIGAGDQLRIRVWGQVNFNADVRVDRSGEVYIPQVGQIHVAGLPYAALRDHLRAAIGRVYRNFDLTADVGQIRAIQVYVVGQARRPGTYSVSSLSTLVDTLFVSGGPSVQGSMRHIQLKRGGEIITDFDLYDLLINGDKSKDVKLLPGDVIYIPATGPQVALTGSVRKPAIYELRSGETIADLFKLSGGTTAIASNARVSIERIQDHENRAAMEVAFDTTGLATPLRDGDILRVLSIVPRYQKTVTLRGNTANPGRFAWHEGMKLSDLIPDQDSLLTRNYWWKRTRLGLPSQEFEAAQSYPCVRQPNSPVDLPRNRNQLPAPVTPGYPSSDPSMAPDPLLGGPYYPSSTQQAQGNLNYNSYGLTRPYYGPDCETYGTTQSLNSPNPYLPNSYNSNQPLYNPLGTNQQANAAQAQRDGQSQSNVGPGSGSIANRQTEAVTQNTASATEHTTVALSAPEVDWDYAVIERLDKTTLKTSLLPFDLGKLVMEHDPNQNLQLLPGDVVTIFSQADIRVPLDQQTKFVRLDGEVAHAGIYSVQPGETLRELVRRAGGLTSNAYLYGSEFTRESTRVVQQQRIDEYVQNLQMEISRGSLAASATSNAQNIAAATASEASSRELITRLQQIRATGRVVLEMSPKSTNITELPDLGLEDGDRFVVPSKPASVNVVGSVYDQNSFVYNPDRRIGDYLHLAGGPNRSADRRHAFVIRADGSVVSRVSANGLWGNNFDALPVNPGDTIIVPEKTFRPSGLRNFLEYSQLFSSMALGVAAISVL